MKVYFVGAGPGDPELLTIRGKEVIERADCIIYAGSLVNREVLSYASQEAVIHNSAQLNLNQILALIREAVARGELVARVHTGDPSLYGAIQEQIDALREEEIEVEVIPGVSSFLAAAASLGVEYTLPEVAQSLIITRLEGRTPVPEKERLGLLARHGTSMVIFLSIHLLDGVVSELKKGYGPETPVVVIQKASWPEEVIVRGRLSDIKEKIEEAGIESTALIMVGDFLEADYSPSRLYDPSFSHAYRQGREEKK